MLKNNPFLIRKRTFKYISYFEKLLLVLFYKKGWFEYSVANLYRKKDIIDYRRNFYPLIYSFHQKHDKFNYEIETLNFCVKQYKYYLKNKLYSSKLKNILKFCFIKNNKNFVKFLMLQNLYINKYYDLNSYFYFFTQKEINLVKLNRTFNIFLLRSFKKLVYFNLDKWYDWYNYNFNNNILKRYDLKTKLTKKQKKQIKDFKIKKLFEWINRVYKYKKRLIEFNKFIDKKFKGIMLFKFNLNNFFKIKINADYSSLLKYYKIKFSESSISKYINSKNLRNYNISYIRKNRIFNKGRYSRNRQLYRTGVYWCLWLNIIIVYGLYFLFYRFTFNFGYFWWGILVLAYSTIFSRIIKYNFYNINYLYKEFLNLIKWYGSLITNFYSLLELTLKNYFLNANIYNYISKYKNNTFDFFFSNYYYYFINNFNKWVENRKRIKMVYMWQGMKEKDNSFLRYKTVIHWIKEIYRLIIT